MQIYLLYIMYILYIGDKSLKSRTSSMWTEKKELKLDVCTNNCFAN